MILKRLRNLWKLSKLDILPYEKYEVKPDFTVSPINSSVEIIKKKSATDEFLKNLENEQN